MKLPGRGRYRLRFRVFVAVVAGALLPLLLVTAWSQLERPVPNTIVHASIDAVTEASAALAASGSPEEARAAVDVVARGRGAWIRLLGEDGETVLSVDHDVNRDELHPIERFFFGALSLEEAARLEAKRGPLLERTEVRLARSKAVDPAPSSSSLRPAPYLASTAYPPATPRIRGLPSKTSNSRSRRRIGGRG